MERMIHEAVLKERMERMIHEAAMKGSVTTLLQLLQEDALILDRFAVGCFAETPLHIAAMLGHLEFVKEILNRKPELAEELDVQKSSPLHLATAKGYLEVVKLLLSAKPEMCSAQDRQGRNPLHIAVMKGRVDVLKELVGARPQAAQIRVDRGETILHLCVKHIQLEAMKLLGETMGDHEFVNSKDNDGFTILHLAVADKQSEIINYLITNTSVEINALNTNGFTALDILAQSRRELKDIDVDQSLQRAGAARANDISLSVHEAVGNIRPIIRANNQVTGPHSNGKSRGDWLEKKQNALMVVASLIATMAFQAGINPPGGVWQVDEMILNNGRVLADSAGKSIMGGVQVTSYKIYIVVNSIGFMASLSIILLLISGLPLKNSIFVWILTVIMWVAISSMALTYTFAMAFVSLAYTFDENVYIVLGTVLVWIGVMGILLSAHTIRLIVMIIRNISRRLTRERDPSSLMTHSSI